MKIACKIFLVLCSLLGTLSGDTWAQQVLATWIDTSSGSAQEDYFILERRTMPNGSYFDIGHPPQDVQQYIDTQVIVGTSYGYRLKAHNSVGDSPYSNEAFITVAAQTAGPSSISCLYSPAIPGLVASYNFNNTSGTSVADKSGNNNNGSLQGATWDAAGKYGQALSFNGTNALVSIPNSSSLSFTQGMTLEAWVNPAAIGGWRDIIMKNQDIYYLEASSSAGPPAFGGTYAGTYVSGVSNLPINVWSHISATYDRTTMRLYINGVQVANRAQTGNIQTSTGALNIGGDSVFGQWFQGKIDEVRIYNRALSQSEIQSDMNTPIQ